LALTTTIRLRDAGQSRGSSAGRFMQNIKVLALLLIVSAGWILASEVVERALLVSSGRRGTGPQLWPKKEVANETGPSDRRRLPLYSNPACPLAAWLKRKGCAETMRPVWPIDGSGMRKPHFGKFGAISSIFLMGLIAAWKRFVKRKLEGCCENGRIDQERGDKYAVLNQPLASTQATEVNINTARKINPKMAPSRQ
jgi:hypothetical protein